MSEPVTLYETIRKTLAHYNARASHFGRDQIPEAYVPALAAMLETSVQRAFAEIVSVTFEEPERAAPSNDEDVSDAERLEEALSVLKLLLARNCVGASTSYTVEDLWKVEGRYLHVEQQHDTVHLSLHSEPPNTDESDSE